MPDRHIGLWALAVCAAAAAHAAGPNIEARVIAQLSCPLEVTKIVAVYGPAGARYKPAFYADVNPDNVDKLWLYGVFTNNGEDTITTFTCDVIVWDAAGKELFRSAEVFDLPLRDKPQAKEWSWRLEGAAAAAIVIFVPRVITYPAGRTWDADERFIEGKIKEMTTHSE